MQMPLGYCRSRMRALRRHTRVVMIGHVPVGGTHPIAVQSMTTTLTQDVEATVRQARALAEAGCDIVRITAPHMKAAEALKDIRARLTQDGIHVPLVADIHFLPAVAMEAVEHVEKIRVNPGNYADKKKFAVREYTDSQYDEELQRLYDAFSPLVIRAKELGRAMRIGTNHGSLSDRIMNRYGDSPEGMVQSALEFVRIAESHGYRDIVLSLKASNPKVMIAAYRLAAARMEEAGMDYPLHLGVTEAGDGEDGRIKSAIGIGSLLQDGLGDTIRVSLTEDPVYEVPVARELAEKAMHLWHLGESDTLEPQEDDSTNPFDYRRRNCETITLPGGKEIGGSTPPAVWLGLSDFSQQESWNALSRFKDTPLEGLIFPYRSPSDLDQFYTFRRQLPSSFQRIPGIADIQSGALIPNIESIGDQDSSVIWVLPTDELHDPLLKEWILLSTASHRTVILDTNSNWIKEQALFLNSIPASSLIFTCSHISSDSPSTACYRALVQALSDIHLPSPVWIRNHNRLYPASFNHFQSRLLDASMHSGSLLCDGIGDILSIEHEPLPAKALTLGYNILQGARARISKTEFVACPSCGRTLFDLQSTTQRIREKTGHLKGVTIAVMGCIVNGPGEMADADFGYVGGAPKKVNLYVGKQCVEYHVPEEEADQRLINLIKKHGKWVDPEPMVVHS
jgi:(E)-4-hydroxy-3-methylbut-2-enyl-diphosphate synthase